MGMSRDYDMAIQNGSTFVRIGSAFFKEERRITLMALKDAIDKDVSYLIPTVTNYENAAKREAKRRPVKARQ